MEIFVRNQKGPETSYKPHFRLPKMFRSLSKATSVSASSFINKTVHVYVQKHKSHAQDFI